MGIGNIPNAVLAGLTHHKDLGIHTEMFSDGILPLVKNGNINNVRKALHQGRIVTVRGSRVALDVTPPAIQNGPPSHPIPEILHKHPRRPRPSSPARASSTTSSTTTP